MTRAPLVDGHGRPIGDVRVSVTDRCNFRCQYCMPAEGLPWLDARGDPHLRGDRAPRRPARVDGRPRRAPDRRRAARAQRAVAAGRDARADSRTCTTSRSPPTATCSSARSPSSCAPGCGASTSRWTRWRPTASSSSPAATRWRRCSPALRRREAHPELRPIKVNVVALRDFTEDEVAALRRVRARAALRGALHRVHAARRRPGVDRATASCPTPRSAR